MGKEKPKQETGINNGLDLTGRFCHVRLLVAKTTHPGLARGTVGF